MADTGKGLSIWCPQCGAEPGTKCLDAGGGGEAEWLDEAHFLRAFAEEVRGYVGDLAVIAGCVRLLDTSTSRHMLHANLEYLRDRYIVHPSRELPEHLK